MGNTRRDHDGFVGVAALALMSLGCTSLEDLASYSAGAAGAAAPPRFEPSVSGPAGEASLPSADAGAGLTAASEGQSAGNVPLIPTGTSIGADDCSADDEFTDSSADAEPTRCYILLADTSSWREARDACEQWGGDLADVRSAGEHALLSERVDEDVWLGASDVGEEGLFRWLDGTEVGDEGDWGPGQPDNYEGRENCLELRAFDDNWNDVPCMSNKRGMCERAFEATRSQ